MSHPEPNTGAAATEHKPRGGLMSKLNVLLFLVAVIGGECLVAYFFFPSASEVAAAAKSPTDAPGKPAKKDSGAHDAHDGHDAQDDHGDHDPFAADKNGEGAELMETDLKQFNLTCTRPASNTAWRVEFHLHGVIQKSEEAEFKKLLEHHENRIRDQIGFIIRAADLAELSDPGLGLLKRKILTKVNATLGKPLLRGVVFSEFTFTEQ